MSEKLWVEYKTDKKTSISKVSIKGCEDVDDFIEKIKSHTQFSSIKDSEITLHGPSGTAIRPIEPISVLLPGNSAESPLRVKVSDYSKPTPNAKLTKFWNSLREISKVDMFLHFSVIPKFFPDNFKTLYVRKAYEDLFAIIYKNRYPDPPKEEGCYPDPPKEEGCYPDPPKEEGLRGMAISGTPGIGKSVFLFYILWRLANIKDKGKVILHRRADLGSIYIFQDDGCWRTRNLDDIEELLEDPKTWYLADTLSSSPEGVKGVTILVSSPSEKHYSEFLKCSHVAALHYLPVWSFDELKLVAPSYKRSEEVVKERFDMIGGLPRYVLEKKVDLIEVIDEAVSKLPLNKLILIALGEVSREDQISHRIVHFKVEPPFYTKRTLTIASAYALSKASEKFLKQSEHDVKYFIYWSVGIPSLAFFRARVFEGYAHQKLSEGGEFPTRCLENNTKGTFTLPERRTEIFHDLPNCKDSNVYYVPKNPFFPCIDSVIPGVGYFQVTTRLRHPIGKQKMREIVDTMHVRKFYFVVPDSNFEKFRKQKLEKKNLKASDGMDEMFSQISELEVFEEVENLDENLMEGNTMNDAIWDPRDDLIEQHVICIKIEMGLDFKEMERIIKAREAH